VAPSTAEEAREEIISGTAEDFVIMAQMPGSGIFLFLNNVYTQNLRSSPTVSAAGGTDE
jgi:hypothetical protein